MPRPRSPWHAGQVLNAWAHAATEGTKQAKLCISQMRTTHANIQSPTQETRWRSIYDDRMLLEVLDNVSGHNWCNWIFLNKPFETQWSNFSWIKASQFRVYWLRNGSFVRICAICRLWRSAVHELEITKIGNKRTDWMKYRIATAFVDYFRLFLR